MKRISRREFLRYTGYGLTGLAAQQFLSACGSNPEKIAGIMKASKSPSDTEGLPTSVASATESLPTAVPSATATMRKDYPHLVVARGEEPEEMVRQGIKALGGMERYMKPGADVIIKPNICVGYNAPEFASTTNPWVVGALVKICLEAGAKSVRVMDYPFGGSAEQCYRISGIEEQVIAAGGSMEVMKAIKYVEVDIPNAVSMTKTKVYQDILNADLLINVPIAKDHSMAKLTLGMKNLMGVIRNREAIHPSFERNLVDLATLVRPQLTIIDAIRTLMDHGPTGGDLDDVKVQNTLIFSPDIVAADAYATRLFDMTPEDIRYIQAAAERGLGMADLSGLKIEEISV